MPAGDIKTPDSVCKSALKHRFINPVKDKRQEKEFLHICVDARYFN